MAQLCALGTMMLALADAMIWVSVAQASQQGCLDFALAAVEAAGDVHQAAGVGRDDHLRACFFDEVHLISNHSAADLRKANRK